MDPADGLTEEERLHLGAQQAAMISLQEEMQMQRDDMVVMPPQRGIMGPDAIDPNLIQMQTAALAEQEKEAELMHQQQMAIMERNREEQMMKQQAMLASGPPPSQATPSQSMPPPPGLSAPRMQPPPAPPGFQSAGPPPPHMMGPPGITSGNQHMAQPPPGLSAPPLQPPQSAGPAPPGTSSGPLPHRMRPPPSFSQPPSGPPGTQPLPLSHGPPGISSGPPGLGMPPSSQPGPPGLSGDRNSSGFSTDGPTHLSQSGGMRGPPPPGFGRRLENQPPPNQGPPPGDNIGPPSLEGDKPREVKLPTALEKVLAFKGERASQVGVAPEDIEKVEKGEMPFVADEDEEMASHYSRPEMTIGEEYGDEEEEEPEPPSSTKKESKNKKKKKKKKKAKQRRFQSMNVSNTEPAPEDDVEIEYIQEAPAFDSNDPMYSQFADIFKAFKIEEPEKAKAEEEAPKEEVKKETPKVKGILDSDDDDDDDDDLRGKDDDDKPKISKKKLKKISRLSVAELKQLVHRPDVVEMHDVTARDPKLLVLIKATRNTVTVPRHWCFKRKYLQGKRGIEKPPFELPEYIKQTGVMEMRAALAEKEDQKSMKQKMRERVRPKMGKIDIDYQKLHDAFFKWQIKPKMTIHGDLYYEGKEFETRLKEKKPGNLSDDLRTALGMPIGDNSEKVPPPWLIAMQRYGPPPSYPNLKIPGLNAPIPESCSFGYHAGGWGKPPVDENGKPLYGDVFGVQGAEVVPVVTEDDIDKSHWGELESESESEEESEEDSDEEAEGDMTGLVTPGETGLVTPSGVASVPIGVETPDMIELRKRRIEDAIDAGGDTPALYTVLPEKKAAVGGAMMGSAHVYDLSAVAAGAAGAKGRPGQPGAPNVEGVDIALNPEELDLDTAAMQAKYEQTMREQQQSQLEKEDLSDMVAEHAAKQQKKRKKQQQDGKSAKKYKDFKF